MTEARERIANLSPEQRRELLARMAKKRRGAILGPIAPGIVVPATVQQQQQWFVHRLDAADAANNLAYAWTFTGALDVNALHSALQHVVDTHEMLRSSLTEGTNLEIRVEPTLSVKLPSVDLRKHLDPEAAFEKILPGLVGTRFDLERAPLHLTQLFQLAEDVHVLVFVIHHVVWDAGSVEVFLRDLATSYRSAIGASMGDIEQRSIGYRSYAVWQRERLTERRDAMARRWREILTDAPITELPTDRARPPVQTFGGSAVDMPLLGSVEWARLLEVFQNEQATAYTGTFGLFAYLIGRWTRSTDVVLGSPVDLRLDPKLESTIGYFVNLVAVRCPGDGPKTGREQVRATRECVLEALEIRELPFAEVVAAVNPDRSPDRNPLVQIEFAFESLDADITGGWPEICLNHRKIHDGGSRFDVSFIVRAGDNGLTLTVEYNHDLFDRVTIESLAETYRTLLGRVLAEPDAPLNSLQLNDDGARRKLEALSDGGIPTSALLESVLSRVLRRAVLAPESVAVSYRGIDLTYSDLARQVQNVRGRLTAAGVRPGDRVLLLARQSPEAIAGMLACHSVGAAYIPLDPDLPETRLHTIVNLADAAVFMVADENDQDLSDSLAGNRIIVRCAVDDAKTTGDPEVVDELLEYPAYVLFTSGSTGLPKGVEVGQEALAHFCQEIGYAYAMRPGDRVLAFARLTFDVSVFEVFATLHAGATICIMPSEARYDPVLLTQFMQDEAVTVAELPPALMPQLSATALPDLRLISVGGEAFAGELVETWTKEGRQFWNGYGPTECTVAVTLQECIGSWSVNPPIGRPLPGCRAYVLDDRGELVPRGAVGELAVAGRSLARGYLADEQRTSEQFVMSPSIGERVYLTGDLVRWRGDESLDFLGRRDSQVKVNGYRIELAEIEAALQTCDGVMDAVVDVVDRAAGRSLVAWIVESEPKAGARALTTVRSVLPGYAVPHMAVPVDSIPLMSSGKLDRKTLQTSLDLLPTRTGGGRAARDLTATERSLIDDVVAPVLGVKGDIDPDLSFFELGGNSLQATQVVAQTIRRFRIQISVADFFQNPSSSDLARLIESRQLENLEGIPNDGDR